MDTREELNHALERGSFNQKISESDIKKMFTTELGENLCNGIPPWFFNFWWRFINLVDEKTSVLKFPLVVQHTAYKIALPLTISTTFLSLFIHALRSKEVKELLKNRDYHHAIKTMGMGMMSEAKNPDTIFNALYSFSTCLGWTVGNAWLLWMISTSCPHALINIGVGASGAITGYLLGALSIGLLWGSISYAYQVFHDREQITSRSITQRSQIFFYKTLNELPGLAVCSGMSSANQSTMTNIPGNFFRYILDSGIVATASSAANVVQMVVKKIFSPTKPLSEPDETSALLGQQESTFNIEKSEENQIINSHYQSGFTIFEPQTAVESSSPVPHPSLKKF